MYNYNHTVFLFSIFQRLFFMKILVLIKTIVELLSATVHLRFTNERI